MEQRPNILLIVTDQQRRDTIGAYGSTLCKTPHVDRLAPEGVVFDHAFTPCGLCSPVRSSLFTGVYPHTHQTLTNIELHPVRNQITPGDDVLARGLLGAGYQLGYVGKWHVNRDLSPLDFGFHRYVSLGDYTAHRKRRTGQDLHREVHNYLYPTSAADTVTPEESRQAFLADKTIEMIEDFTGGSNGSNRPFFVRMDFHGPHPPMVVPEPYASTYPPEVIPPFANFSDPLENKPAVQATKRRQSRGHHGGAQHLEQGLHDVRRDLSCAARGPLAGRGSRGETGRRLHSPLHRSHRDAAGGGRRGGAARAARYEPPAAAPRREAGASA